MSRATHHLINSLAEKYGFIRSILTQHVDDNFGEVLPHVFFGDLSRTAGRMMIESNHDGPIRSLLSDLEQAFANANDDVVELISVSFLENLPRRGEPGFEIRNMLGPRLANELRRIG